MKTTYNKTIWEDNKTPVNAANLNNIENGISGLYSNALSVSDLIESDGIEIKSTSEGITFGLNFRCVDNKPNTSTSEGNVGDYYTDGDYIFFCISQNTWIKLKIENF